MVYLSTGSLLRVVNVSLPKATFVKFRPQSVDFLEISNPRAVLERALRNFSCVTVGDQICIPYNDKYYYLEVREVKPADAACIIETDCNVDFEAPVGYKEPEWKPANGGSSALESKGSTSGGVIGVPRALSAKGGYVAENKDDDKPKFFTGSGQRLDGKPSRTSTPTTDGNAAEAPLPTPPPVVENAAKILAGRTISGGQVVGSASGGGATLSASARAAEARRPIAALGGKYSSKKTFSSFGGQGNTFK